jgi:hypothetical protein
VQLPTGRIGLGEFGLPFDEIAASTTALALPAREMPAYASGTSVCRSRVEPSMSVKKKVTVPDGRSPRTVTLALRANQLVQRMGSWIEHVLRLLGAGDGKRGLVDQADLDEE